MEILDDEEGDDQKTMDTHETRKKIDLFEVHMKKVTKLDETITVFCNYCSKEFKLLKSKGYGTYRLYITNTHPTKSMKSKAKGQIFHATSNFSSIVISISPPNDKKN